MSRNPTPQELLTSIRAKCLDCVCGSRKEVERCRSESCPLWAYRDTTAREKPKPMRGQITMFELENGG